MRKKLLFLFIALMASTAFRAQTKGSKVGYIDMEYILQNVPNYTEAQQQLEEKAQKWKQEIEQKKNEVSKLKEALKAEKALLTKGLVEERITEIEFLENEVLEFQQKRFGPNGDLMILKAGLTKPIQDQVFTAVQDIAEAKKYDFIFDKTSDMTILFAAKRFDISDQIVRILNRTEKREQMSKKQLKAEEAKEAKETALEENPALSNRQSALDAKKAERDKIIADRKQQQEERRIQILAEREAKKTGITTPSSTNATATTQAGATSAAADQVKQKTLEDRAALIEARKKTLEDNKKAQEEKRNQILADREAKKTGAASVTPNAKKSSEVTAKTTVTDGDKVGTVSESNKDEAKITSEEDKQKQLEIREKTLADRNKLIEERKKALEEKKKKILAEREAARIANEEKIKEQNKQKQ